MLHNTRVIWPHHSRLWKIRAPPKVKVFLWTLLQNKLLTRDTILRRGCNGTTGRVMCQDSVIRETTVHFFWNCTYTKEFWNRYITGINVGVTISGARSHIHLWKKQLRALEATQIKTWEIAWSAGQRAIWRERNNKTFNERSKPILTLTNETVMDVRQ